MKSVLLSMVALAALAGAQAAEVVGNNTAIVIRRENVASSSGHHLLCVPVAPLDISGSSTGAGSGTPLGTLLPASLYPLAEVTVNADSQADSVTYQAENGVWKVKQASGGDSTDGDVGATVLLSPKQVIWLSNPADKAEVRSEKQPIVFCGEQNDAMDSVSTEEGLHSIGNATSEVKTLAQVFSGSYGKGTQILHIAKLGDAEYTRYYYYGPKTGWKKFDSNGITDVELSGVEIQPGEAVYYYAKSVAD